MSRTSSLRDYITAEWPASVRCGGDRRGIHPVPVPHTVPSPRGVFQAIFYWDLYFTNLGLIISGRTDLARSNCEALLWFIDQRGFVPNSNFVGDDNRSQPPVLAVMLENVWAATADRAWLEAALPRLERELGFWATRRQFASGLAHFGHDADDAYLDRFYREALHPRLGLPLDAPAGAQRRIAGQRLAEAESGLDFTPVFAGEALAFADVKLNTLLWRAESLLAQWHAELGHRDPSARWQQLADHRAARIHGSLWDERSGQFRSRHDGTGAFAAVDHVETFYPLWAGLATPAQAARVRAALPVFEREHGLAQTAPVAGGPAYQWAFPIGWPPSHWIAADGLRRYGFAADARRIAGKYCVTQELCFAACGHLWEKIDVTRGEPAQAEYPSDPMLGWTAGVYLALDELRRG